MTTITLKINERTKAGKAFMIMAETFFKEAKGIEIVKSIEENPYSPQFVKMVKDAEKQIAQGKTTTINPNDIWGSLGLK